MRAKARARLLPLLAGIPAVLFAAGAAGGRLLSHPRVDPAVGSPVTRFKVSLRAPIRTGRSDAIIRRIVLDVRGPSRSGCISRDSTQIRSRHAGARIRATLDPAKLGGNWCPGSFHGRLIEVISVRCAQAHACPASLKRRRLIGRFAFTVRRTTPANGTGPTFAGLERATFCAPGPASPQGTRIYRLTWQTASDPVTPGTQIVYEVFMASAPGAEDFAQPTWTTAPGATSYETPSQPADGDRYFVVRARDQAGKVDQNDAERAGVNIC